MSEGSDLSSFPGVVVPRTGSAQAEALAPAPELPPPWADSVPEDHVQRRGDVAVCGDRAEATTPGVRQLAGEFEVVLAADVEEDVEPLQAGGRRDRVVAGVVDAVGEQ